MRGALIVAGAVGLAGAGLVVGTAGSAWAGSQAPGGNNGTIKIEAGPPDDDKANEPHVTCAAYVEFWGYDQGTQTADLTFDAHAPTAGGTVYHDTTSWTTPHREGGRHLDKTYGPVDLASAFAKAGIAPAKQGYHVKLTVHVTGSKGSDVKHKVFWVEPCNAGATTTTVARTSTTVKSTTTSTTARPYVAPASGSTAAPAAGVPTGAPTAIAVPTEVLGIEGTATEQPRSVAAAGTSTAQPAVIDAVHPTKVLGAGGSTGGSLPFTGAAVGGIAVLGLGTLATGEALRRSGRTLRLRRTRG
jgi:hypothetical protein